MAKVTPEQREMLRALLDDDTDQVDEDQADEVDEDQADEVDEDQADDSDDVVILRGARAETFLSQYFGGAAPAAAPAKKTAKAPAKKAAKAPAKKAAKAPADEPAPEEDPQPRRPRFW